ncbi:MAG: DUF2058 family protein [Candidatus Competibacterales bacterium]
MSLRDQLLKSGLVDEAKAKQTEKELKKKTHRAKKDKSLAAAEEAKAKAKAEAKAREEAEKRERDRALNAAREAEKRRREAWHRMRQIIDSQRVNDPSAEGRYYFKRNERQLHFVRVTPQQRAQLASGQLGIVRSDDNPYDYPLVTRDAALRIAEISTDHLLLLHPQAAPGVQDGDEAF